MAHSLRRSSDRESALLAVPNVPESAAAQDLTSILPHITAMGQNGVSQLEIPLDFSSHTQNCMPVLPNAEPFAFSTNSPQLSVPDGMSVVSFSAPVSLNMPDVALQPPTLEMSQVPLQPSLEVPLEVPLQPSLEVPLQPSLEVPLQPSLEVPLQPSLEILLEVPLQPSLEIPLEVPLQPSLEIPPQPSLEVPLEVPLQPSLEVPLQPTLLEIPMN
jgi:hypothetical protein